MDNESRLRSILSAVPGNLECADCGKSGKHHVKFCSVTLGVFLCNQCYGAHRALGAHVTRGKCMGLDGFSDQEVQLLADQGNVRVNAKYEATMPSGAKPPPTSCNGCSSRLCRDCCQRLDFIRNKYERKLWFSETAVPSMPAPFTNDINGHDPFGLWESSNQNPKPSLATTLQPTTSGSPSDSDFFASFGL